jgi:TolA-binding protein
MPFLLSFSRRILVNMCTKRLYRVLAAAAFFAILFIAAASAFAGENEDLNFAKKLRRDGMYVAAAEEFMRFTEKYPQSVFRPEALFSAAESYLQAVKANDALNTYEKFIEAYPKDERACLARLQRGKIFKALKRYKEGADELLLIPDENPACPVVDQALLDAADCLMSMGDSEGASKVLRRLINERKDSQLTPRARYTLALALINTGRDMEADQVLADVAKLYPTSPVRALALVKLGERSLAKNDYAKAESYFRSVEKDFKEDPLSEKAVLGLIDIHAKRGNADGVLSESERFLEKYPNSDMRAKVMRGAIDAALRSKKPDRALALVNSLKSGKAASDTTGELSLLTARALMGALKTNEAIAELERMRRAYPASPFLREAIVLEAEVRDRSGSPLEAARLYNLALMGNAGRDERLRLNASLAELSAARLADTLSAIRYWQLVADEDKDGSAAEEAIYRESVLKEKIGDVGGATRGFEAVVSRFPEGTYAQQAKDRLAALAVHPVWNESIGRRLGRVASWEAGPAQRSLETGVILVDGARDAETAVPLLESALAKDLPDSLRAKGSYYLGTARIMRAQAAAARGEDAKAERARGLDMLKSASERYANTVWGERASREYIDRQEGEWTLAERLGRIEEYMAAYGRGQGRSWGLTKRAKYLFERASQGDTVAANAALAATSEVLGSGAPAAEKKEALLIGASLMRAKGNHAGAARAYGEFVSAYPEDSRVTGVLYDLGEELLAVRDYAGAVAAYDRCLARAPGRAIAEKCMIRKGDCLYYRGAFAEAADAYAGFAAAYPESDLVGDAIYREALAREKGGDTGKADELLQGLLAKEGLPRAVRLRALAWLGGRYLEGRRYDKARPLLVELAAGERTAANLTMAGEAELGAGDFNGAVKSFSDALAAQGADSCRVVAGRAKTYMRLKQTDSYERDTAILASRCAAWKGLGGVLLEKGKIEAEEGRCPEAARTLDELQRRFAGTEEGREALFYLALCDLKRGGYREAAEKLETFVASAGSSAILPEAYFKLASSHYGAGNLNLAAKYYALAAESSKESDLSFTAWKNLGSVQQQLEQWNDAAATWQKLVETFPERDGIVDVLFDLGFCYNQAGKNELAYDVYSRIPDVATSEEQQGRAHYWAGMSLKNMGRYDEAIREFLRVPYLRTGGMWGVTSKLEAAGCCEAKGDLAQARTIYESVLAANGPASDWGRVASDGLKRVAEREAAGGGKAGETSGKKE